MSETTTLNDLPPCPFCGGKDLSMDDMPTFSWMICNKCGANGPTARNAQQAMKRWSKRHSGGEGQ